jgi:hypothetical protein
VALSRARALAAIPEEVFEEKLAEPKPSRAKLLAEGVLPSSERTVDPSGDESRRLYGAVRGPLSASWPDEFDVGLLNEKAVLTVRERQESSRRWCDRWAAALADVPQIRRVK